MNGNYDVELKALCLLYRDYIKTLAIKFSRISSPFSVEDFIQAAHVAIWSKLMLKETNKPHAYWRRVVKWAMNDFRKVNVCRHRRIFNRLASMEREDDYEDTKDNND